MRSNTAMHRTLMGRRGVQAPPTMQEKTVSAIRDVLFSAGLQGAETWTYSNVGEITVTQHGSFEPLFTVRLNFQDDYLSGGVFLPGEQNVNDAPHRTVGGTAEMVQERSFYAQFAKPEAMTKVIETIRRQADIHAPDEIPTLGRLPGIELTAAVDECVAAEGAEAVLARMVSFLADHADREENDDILAQAVDYLRKGPSPKP